MIPRRSFQKRVEEEDRRLEDDRHRGVFLDTIPDVEFALLRIFFFFVNYLSYIIVQVCFLSRAG